MLAAITMGVSIALAYLVYRIVDKPGQRLLKTVLEALRARVRPARGSRRSHRASVP